MAINRNSRARLGAKLRYLLASRPSPRLILDRLRNRRARLSFDSSWLQLDPTGNTVPVIERVEHHLTHLASAYYASEFDQAKFVSIDGFDDLANTAWRQGSGARLSFDGCIQFPHSLGIFYQALTLYRGFT